MNRRVVNGMCVALFDSDLVATRLMLAIAEMCWAVMLLWPGNTFERPTYTAMGHLAPEVVWALVFMATSVVQYRIVVMGWARTRGAWFFSCWNSLLWGTAIACMMYSVQPPPAAIGGEVALMMGAIWIWVRPLVMKRWERRYAAKRA